MDDLTHYYADEIYKDRDGKLVNPNLALLTNEWNNYNTFVLQGGTRSGKTYSIMMWILGLMMQYGGVKYAIVRQSKPVLKATVINDFVEIALKFGIYSDENHNKSDQIFKYNNNTLEFVAGEDESKLRGLKTDVLYINEAPELEWESVKQLLFRNTTKTIFDYNPSYPESWMYDNILTRDGVAFLRTTYEHNPFLSAKQLDEILWMKENDPDGYLIYGLGERGEMKGRVYNNFHKIKNDQFPVDNEPYVYVIDFGWNPDPTCIMKLRFDGRNLYAKELLYRTEMNFVARMIFLWLDGFVNEHDILIADGADPQAISELRFGDELITKEEVANKAAELGVLDMVAPKIDGLVNFIKEGVQVLGSIRNQGVRGSTSIKSGIREVKRYKVYLTESSINAWSEYHKYIYKKDRRTGNTTSEPIEKYNHAMDAIRMGVQGRGRLFEIIE